MLYTNTINELPTMQLREPVYSKKVVNRLLKLYRLGDIKALYAMLRSPMIDDVDIETFRNRLLDASISGEQYNII